MLSNEELLTAAEDDKKRNQPHTQDLVFGLLDCSMALYLVFPIFGQRVDSVIEHISLLGLAHSRWYLTGRYFTCVLGLVLLGVLTLLERQKLKIDESGLQLTGRK